MTADVLDEAKNRMAKSSFIHLHPHTTEKDSLTVSVAVYYSFLLAFEGVSEHYTVVLTATPPHIPCG